MPRPRSQLDMLLEGLVGREIDLYNNNASFYNAINSLAPLVIAQLDYIKKEAIKAEEQAVIRKRLMG